MPVRRGNAPECATQARNERGGHRGVDAVLVLVGLILAPLACHTHRDRVRSAEAVKEHEEHHEGQCGRLARVPLVNQGRKLLRRGAEESVEFQRPDQAVHTALQGLRNPCFVERQQAVGVVQAKAGVPQVVALQGPIEQGTRAQLAQTGAV